MQNGEALAQAEAIIGSVIPEQPHEGFFDRNQELVTETKQQLLGSLATISELDSIEEEDLAKRVNEVFHRNQTSITLFNTVRSIDNYLYNQDWQYDGERKESHQENAIFDILKCISMGNKDSYAEIATSGGKSYIIAKLAEACEQAGMRVLILAHTKVEANQLVGKNIDKGLERFAPKIDQNKIGRQFAGFNATKEDRVVVSTYQSLNSKLVNGDLGEFDIVLCDEVHRALGEKTSENIINFSPHAVKVGFTATPEFGINKAVSQIFPECAHSINLRESIEADLVAPIQCLTYTTGATIRIRDPNRRDFTDRETARLISLKSRNEKAIQFARNFVEEGRQGIISCIPGEDLAHAKLLADQLSKETIIDSKTGEERLMIAKAIGNSINNSEEILAEYAEGKVDVLTFVNALGEGWDSQVASFLINVCPTTSLVKITQLIGRVIRKKDDNKISILVDFIDQAVAKNQMTALHALGEITVDITKVYQSTNTSFGGNDRDTYLRNLLDLDLYTSLMTVDGSLISELTIPPKSEFDRRRIEYFEKILVQEGLYPDTNIYGVPPKILIGIDECRDFYLANQHRLPSRDELYDYLKDHDLLRKKYSYEQLESALKFEHVELEGLLEDYSEVVGAEAFPSPDDSSEMIDRGSLIKIIQETITDKRTFDLLMYRWGFIDGEPHTYDETGERINLTRERIRQIESRAMAMIRYPYKHNNDLRAWLSELSNYELDSYANQNHIQLPNDDQSIKTEYTYQKFKFYRDRYINLFRNGMVLSAEQIEGLSDFEVEVYYGVLKLENSKNLEVLKSKQFNDLIESFETIIPEVNTDRRVSYSLAGKLPSIFRNRRIYDVTNRKRYLARVNQKFISKEEEIIEDLTNSIGRTQAYSQFYKLSNYWFKVICNEVDEDIWLEKRREQQEKELI